MIFSFRCINLLFFFPPQVFDKTMKKKLYDRLLYIFCSQVPAGTSHSVPGELFRSDSVRMLMLFLFCVRTGNTWDPISGSSNASR